MKRNDIAVISAAKSRVNKAQNGQLLHLVVSGSHLYGFESVDSDIDYRGTFITDTRNLLGLERKRDVLRTVNAEIDIELHEISKTIGLALKGNCNILEHLNAKPVYVTPEFLDLRQMINNAFGKIGIYKSYRGMATFNYKKFIQAGRLSPKKYLYIFRGLMAGIYVLQTGKIQPNLAKLNQYFKLSEVKDLIKAKKRGMEKGTMPPELDSGTLESQIEKLYLRLDKAYEKSKIPHSPALEDRVAIAKWLIAFRRTMLNESEATATWLNEVHTKLQQEEQTIGGT